MTKLGQASQETVDASPVKSFFVRMLTRDIMLEEAILDLLDNCVDGVLRSNQAGTGKTPYKGFYAHIDFNKDMFSISDNCGGIPWNLKDYAFRMGRSTEREHEAIGSVGVYGIGMKRAIFKIGRECLISTQNEKHRYEVEIGSSWIDDEESWDIPINVKSKNKKPDGTTLLISKLNKGIREQFGTDSEAFFLSLEKMVASHYAYIIHKGFTVKINSKTIKPLPTELVFTTGKGASVKPYIWEATIDGVDVYLAVGFTRPIPSQNEIDDELELSKYSSDDAGWTVLCNDRAVLYKDKSELTGWGEATVPQYHTQFIAIAGIVQFSSKDPSKLPTTTTKRGMDASSPLYLKVKNKMREGMKIFTTSTNKWKGNTEGAKKHITAGKRLSLDELKIEAQKSLTFSGTSKGSIAGKQFIPSLPTPPQLSPTTRRISFTKKIKDIEAVAEYLFENRDEDPSRVGEGCFDLILKDAK